MDRAEHARLRRVRRLAQAETTCTVIDETALPRMGECTRIARRNFARYDESPATILVCYCGLMHVACLDQCGDEERGLFGESDPESTSAATGCATAFQCSVAELERGRRQRRDAPENDKVG